MNVRPLNERLRAKEHLSALIVKMPAAAQLQMAAAAGFDFAIVDLEHGVRDTSLLETDLRAAQAAALPTLVRVPSGDAPTVLGVLDAGADGVVVPHVGDVETAQAAAAAVAYPPRGRRSFALTTPAGRWGATANEAHLKAAENLCLVVQIEDQAGAAAAADIAAVEGVDALFIGVNDLALDMTGAVRGDEPSVVAAAGAILAASSAAGKPVMTVTGTQADAARWCERGAQVAVFVAPALVLSAFRGVTSPRPASLSPEPGLPLVLLPGMFETPRLWEAVAERLDGRVSLVPGRIDYDASITEMADSVLAQAPARFALAGHSLGGVVALETALRAPGRVAALALVSMSAGVPDEDQLTAWASTEAEIRASVGEEWAANAAARLLATEEPAIQRFLVRMAIGMGREAALRQLAAQRTRVDWRSQLGELRCPTLVLSAANDAVSPPARQRELAELIPGAQLTVVPDCGHLAPFEQPGETAAAMAAWLGLAEADAAARERT